jgi:signal recognition particle subunit SRP54
MLENLGGRFRDIVKKVKGHGKLTEDNVKAILKEVRLALLEADVNYKVVKQFIAKVKEKSLGEQVLTGINPGQQFVKIVHDELVELLGGTNARLTKSNKPPTVIMLAGLQGAGKTTFAAKLAKYLKKKGEKPHLVGADVYRPAAKKQLQVLGEQIGVTVSTIMDSSDAVEICEEGLANAKAENATYVILDTAGRLHIDESLMDELKNIKKKTRPQEILLVVDAMTGQDAVNVADNFNQAINIDGVILTKLDGDARGGSALSIKAVTNKPIKFVGVGEKLEDIELFHPDRLASRILGMGDVVSLVEKAQEAIDVDEAQRLEEKLRKQEFDLDDFLKQLQNIKKLGPISNLLKMIPGADQLGDLAPAEKEMKKVEAIIQSMTNGERRKPKVINASRKKRIAKGSGTSVHEVNKLLNQFTQMKKVMKMFGGGAMPGMGKMPKMPGGMKFPFK